MDLGRGEIAALRIRREVCLYSFERGTLKVLPTGAKISCLRFSPDERHLVLAAKNGSFRCYDAQTFQLMRSGAFVDRAIALCFREPFSIILAGQKGSIGTADTREKGAPRVVALGSSERLRCAAFGAAAHRLVCGDAAGKLSFWDDRNWVSEVSALTVHAGPVNAIAFNPFRSLLTFSASGGVAPTLAICNSSLSALTKRVSCENQIFDLVCSSAQERVVAALGPGRSSASLATYDNELHPMGEITATQLSGKRDCVLRLAAHPLGERVVACSGSEIVQLWQLFRREKQPNCVQLLNEPEKQLR